MRQQHAQRKTRWMGPSFPLPTKQDQVGLWQQQRHGGWSQESGSVGDREEEIHEGERI